jgi:hypothetical protein
VYPPCDPPLQGLLEKISQLKHSSHAVQGQDDPAILNIDFPVLERSIWDAMEMGERVRLMARVGRNFPYEMVWMSWKIPCELGLGRMIWNVQLDDLEIKMN